MKIEAAKPVNRKVLENLADDLAGIDLRLGDIATEVQTIRNTLLREIRLVPVIRKQQVS